MSRPSTQLSYLRVAEPLTISRIRRSLDEYFQRGCCDEIVMWQHQFDWLKKRWRAEREPRYADPQPYRVYFGCELIPPPPSLPRPKPAVEDAPARIFGIAVRVENPDR